MEISNLTSGSYKCCIDSIKFTNVTINTIVPIHPSSNLQRSQNRHQFVSINMLGREELSNDCFQILNQEFATKRDKLDSTTNATMVFIANRFL